jgi:hypothetical protein
MCSIWFSQQTALTGWALEWRRVSCEVRTELLDIIQISSMPWFSSLSKCSDGSHKFSVATARFSCSPPDQTYNSCSVMATKLCNSALIHKIIIPRPLALTILTSSLHHAALVRRTSGQSLGTWVPFLPLKITRLPIIPLLSLSTHSSTILPYFSLHAGFRGIMK